MVADRSVEIRLRADISGFNRAMLQAAGGAKGLARELDATSSQMGLLVSSSLALGPALIPVAASATPVITGLASQLGFAAVGAGVAAIAFTGMGNALKAVNEYQLDPTVENIAKMREELSKLGPAGQNFVEFMQQMRPQMQKLQETARAGLLPGVEQGMSNFMSMMPQVERIISTVATAMGDMSAQAGEALAGPRWEAFFNYLENEARPTLLAFGQTLGNFTNGIANLFVAFAPASAQFSASFLEMSQSFAGWTANLPNTEGFQGFLDYLANIGPQVWDTLTSIGGAMLSLLEAAAPIGAILLPALEGLAEAFSTIMDSDIGPVLIGAVTAINALALAMKLNGLANFGILGKSLSTMTAGVRSSMAILPAATASYFDYGRALDRVGGTAAGAAANHARFTGALKGSAKAAGAVGILAFAVSDLDEKMGLSNTAMGATIGLIGGPWGVAIGAAFGATMDLAAANDSVSDSFKRVEAALKMGTGGYDQQVAALERAKKALADFKRDRDNESGGMFQGLGNAFGDQKNLVEGFLGSSDVEEAAAKYKTLAGTVRDVGVAKDQARAAELGLAVNLAGTSGALREQTLATLENIAAHNERNNQALTKAEAESKYQAAIDAVTESIKKNGRTVDEGTEKGRNNAGAVRDLAASWNELEPASQLVAGAQEKARVSFITAAQAAGYTAREARALADEYLNVPPDIATEIRLLGKDASAAQIAELLSKYNLARKDVVAQLKATNLTKPQIAAVLAALDNLDKQTASPNLKVSGAKAAIDAANAVKRALDNINPFKNVTITTTRRDGTANATGGAIRGPGTGTSDSIPALLSNGEHVFTAAEVDKAGGQGAIYRLRAGIMAGTVQGFASGGMVGMASGGAVGKAKAAAAKARAEAKAREQRINELITSLKVEVRRGEIIDQATSGLSGAFSVVDDLRAQSHNEDLTKKSRKALGDAAHRAESGMKRLYGQAEAVTTQLDAAKSIQEGLASGLSGSFGLSSMVGQASAGGFARFNSSTALEGAQVRVEQMKKFIGLLEAGRKAGMPPALLSEIVGLGSVEGAQVIESFLALPSASADLAELSKAYDDIASFSSKAGEIVAFAFDLKKAGKDTAGGLAEGFVKGLEDKQGVLNAAIRRMAEGMERALKKSLGIKSPSTVSRADAHNYGDGWIFGLADKQKASERAMIQLVTPPKVYMAGTPAPQNTQMAAQFAAAVASSGGAVGGDGGALLAATQQQVVLLEKQLKVLTGIPGAVRVLDRTGAR